MNTVKRIATYCRVSSARQEEEQTIKTQISTLEDYARKHDYMIVQQYADEGWSGDMLARPDLDRLRGDAKLNNWSAVLIYDPDRLARRYSFQELVMDELREAGKEVIFVTVASPQNSEDKILYGVRGIFAEYERVKITERFRLGKIRRAKEGHILVGRPLYGYDYTLRNENVPGYYTINEGEARVVRMIFNWMAHDKCTIRNISKKLKDLGIKPKRSSKGIWNAGTIGQLLRNTAYYGDFYFGKRYYVIPKNPIVTDKYRKIRKSSARFRPQSDWIKVPIPAIITHELFDKAALQIKVNHSQYGRIKKHCYLLTGLVWCSCGKRMTAQTRDKYSYYYCTDKISSYPLPRTCKGKNINGRLIETLVWDTVLELMCSSELLDKQIRRYIHERQSNPDRQSYDTNVLTKEISNLENIEDRYTKAYAAGILDIEKLNEYLKPLKEQVETLKLQMSGIEQSERKVKSVDIASPKIVESIAEKSQSVLVNADQNLKRTIIASTIQKIVHQDNALYMTGCIPVSMYESGTNANYDEDVTMKSSQDQSVIPFKFKINLPQRCGSKKR